MYLPPPQYPFLGGTIWNGLMVGGDASLRALLLALWERRSYASTARLQPSRRCRARERRRLAPRLSAWSAPEPSSTTPRPTASMGPRLEHGWQSRRWPVTWTERFRGALARISCRPG